MNRLVCMALLATTLAATGSGCCCLDRYYFGDCHRPTLSGRLGGRGCAPCGDAGCADGGCTDGSCATGDCDEGGCTDGSCGAPACGGCGGCDLCSIRPLQAVLGLFTCSKGCGEFYFDEWINDPPEACDPCDQHGGWIGPRCCPPRFWLGMRNLGGYRAGRCCDTSCGVGCDGGDCGGGCTDGSCTSCGHGGDELQEGETIENVPTPMPEAEMQQPTPAQARRPAAKPYYEHPTKRASYQQPRSRSYSSSTRTSRLEPATSSAAIGSGVRQR